MTVSLYELARLYLSNQIPFSRIKDWLALEQWDAPEHEQKFADEVSVLLVHLGDGYIDEDYLRSQLATALENYAIKTTRISFKATVPSEEFYAFPSKIVAATIAATS